MTLNTVFEYADPRDLFLNHTGTERILAIAKRTLTSTTNKLAKYRDWVQYVEEIELFGKRPSGNPFLSVFKMTWSTKHTPTGFPVFVVHHDTTMPDGRTVHKTRPVVDIRGLNKISQPGRVPYAHTG